MSKRGAARRSCSLRSSTTPRVGLALFCPITSRAKGYPFEVAIPAGLPVGGVVLSDQVKSLDWRARRADFICALPRETVTEILEKLAVLLRPDQD
jgi:mRNA interferase MazF